MIADLFRHESRLLEHLPPCRLLDRFTGLHEAGERRIDARRKSMAPPEQQALGAPNRDDHNRVRAREMLRLAARAVAPIAAVASLRPFPAIGAELMPLVPEEKRARLSENGEFM